MSYVGIIGRPCIIAIACFVLLTPGNKATAQNKAAEPESPVIKLYAKTAFATGRQLVKPRDVPVVHFYCTESVCDYRIKVLKAYLPEKVAIDISRDEMSDSVFEVLFFQDDAARGQSKNEYQLKANEVVNTLFDQKCAVFQAKNGFTVVKVIIAVTEDAGMRNNVGCILTELLRASGLNFSVRYQEYSVAYEKMTDGQISQAFNGLSNLMKLHWSDRTYPGMGEKETRQVLSEFEIKRTQ